MSKIVDSYDDLKDLDLIQKFVVLVRQECDGPKVFIEMGGCHLVSTFLGRFWWVADTPFNHRPNPWFVCSSIPGRTRRSSVLSFVTDVYNKVSRKYYTDKVKLTKKEIEQYKKENNGEPTEDLAKDKLNDVIDGTRIEEGTQEGLIDHIEEYVKEHDIDCFAIHIPEFGGVLMAMTAKTYQVGVSALLSN